ncbi:uncharacterized protein LOC115244912, partial [Formica exsecta]|uniref:uncharacterized protein LOC115244912 n=1 Tax=Formica exsecta TaxID=72781 RepID=UPI0011415019
MREINVFAQSYQMMGEELENQRRLEMESGELLPELQLLFTLRPGMDRRQYNAQRTNEVAAVFYTTADGEIPESYVTIRNRNTKILQKVSNMDPNVQPWIYPLFYPYGTQGWHRYLTKLNSDRRITRGQYIKYRMDSNEAIDHRLNQNSYLDFEIVQNLEHIMREINVFAQSYQMMGEELENQRRLEMESGELLPELQLLFTLKPGMDRRRYNAQRTNEVAAVFYTTADGEIPESYVTIRNRNTKILQKVSIMDPNVEPWIYLLFYPYGTQGWHRYLTKLNSDRRITRGQYIKYRMGIRDEFNVFLLGRRLFQQWLVDGYVKIEKDRIDYCKNHQIELHTETYQGLKDYIQTMANNLNGRIGKMVVLSSTFIGSLRNMLQNYQDTMAIVSKFGKPDLFITKTCNPKWREIEENLLPGQQASDRPVICARVFNIKKDYLIDLIVKQKFFGEVAAFVYVIEFQKRGLPHVYMLITLKYNFKITTPKIVDKNISAEIPDPCENRILHDIIMKHMIHGSCSDWCL